MYTHGVFSTNVMVSVFPLHFLIVTEKRDDGTSTDDYSSSYSCSSTGDSGFSDSLAFRKAPPAPNMCQQPITSQPEHVLLTDPDSTYASLMKSQVNSADYYKSLKRENIPGNKIL